MLTLTPTLTPTLTLTLTLTLTRTAPAVELRSEQQHAHHDAPEVGGEQREVHDLVRVRVRVRVRARVRVRVRARVRVMCSVLLYP